ncbi:MAG: hypothetical protein WC663_05490 [Patescibacteria group bacterium]
MRRAKETIGTVIILCVVFLLSTFITKARADEVDIAICNGDKICLQLMELGKIDEKIEKVREDLKLARQSLGLMSQYTGMWKNTEESRDWFQVQREFVCATNERMRQNTIPKIIQDLNSLHESSNPDISHQANLKMLGMQHDHDIIFFLTETPCAKATEYCRKFL